MTRYLTTDSLIESAKRRAMLPGTQVTFKEDDFLAFANEEMDNSVIPYIHSFREDYFIVTEAVKVEPNQLRYRIPVRAVANKLRDVRFRDKDGTVYEMTRIFIEDEPYFQYNAGSGSVALRTFMIEADEIVFPNGTVPVSAVYLDFVYYIRPNMLVSEDRVARVVSVDPNTNSVIIDKYPSVFANQTTFDITSSQSPFKLLAVDIEPTVLPAANNLQMTFTELPTYIQEGDIIALPEETIIPQVPVEAHSLLAHRVAMRCLEALGDSQGLSNASAKLTEIEFKLGSILDDRAEGAVRKINNFHSNLRKSRRWNWWR